jgi:hypothetical protein
LIELAADKLAVGGARGRTGRDAAPAHRGERDAVLARAAACRGRSGSARGAARGQDSIGARAGTAARAARGDQPRANGKRDSASAAARAWEAIVSAKSAAPALLSEFVIDRSCFMGDTGAFFLRLFLCFWRDWVFSSSICFEFDLILLDFLACLHGHGENADSFVWTFSISCRKVHMVEGQRHSRDRESLGNLLLEMKCNARVELTNVYPAPYKRHVSTSCLTTLHPTPCNNQS